MPRTRRSISSTASACWSASWRVFRWDHRLAASRMRSTTRWAPSCAPAGSSGRRVRSGPRQSAGEACSAGFNFQHTRYDRFDRSSSAFATRSAARREHRRCRRFRRHAGVEYVATPRLTLLGNIVGRTLPDMGRLRIEGKRFTFEGMDATAPPFVGDSGRVRAAFRQPEPPARHHWRVGQSGGRFACFRQRPVPLDRRGTEEPMHDRPRRGLRS